MVMNPIEEKMQLIQKKAEELELLSKKKDPANEARIRTLAIDIKILIQKVMIEMDLQDELKEKRK